MNATVDALREELQDREYSEVYAESFLDSFLATQIKVLREENGWTQKMLAERIGTKQGAISRIEDVNYSKWNVSTLKKLAREFRVRLKVSFETYGSLLADVEDFSRHKLERQPREKDSILYSIPTPKSGNPVLDKNAAWKGGYSFIGYQSNGPGALQQSLMGKPYILQAGIPMTYPQEPRGWSATEVLIGGRP